VASTSADALDAQPFSGTSEVKPPFGHCSDRNHVMAAPLSSSGVPSRAAVSTMNDSETLEKVPSPAPTAGQ
jgi:hypothetical protein